MGHGYRLRTEVVNRDRASGCPDQEKPREENDGLASHGFLENSGMLAGQALMVTQTFKQKMGGDV